MVQPHHDLRMLQVFFHYIYPDLGSIRAIPNHPNVTTSTPLASKYLHTTSLQTLSFVFSRLMDIIYKSFFFPYTARAIPLQDD